MTPNDDLDELHRALREFRAALWTERWTLVPIIVLVETVVIALTLFGVIR